MSTARIFYICAPLLLSLGMIPKLAMPHYCCLVLFPSFMTVIEFVLPEVDMRRMLYLLFVAFMEWIHFYIQDHTILEEMPLCKAWWCDDFCKRSVRTDFHLEDHVIVDFLGVQQSSCLFSQQPLLSLAITHARSLQRIAAKMLPAFLVIMLFMLGIFAGFTVIFQMMQRFLTFFSNTILLRNFIKLFVRSAPFIGSLSLIAFSIALFHWMPRPRKSFGTENFVPEVLGEVGLGILFTLVSCMCCALRDAREDRDRQKIIFGIHFVSRIVLCVSNFIGIFCQEPWVVWARNPFIAAGVQAIIMVGHMDIHVIVQDVYTDVNEWLTTFAEEFSKSFMSLEELKIEQEKQQTQAKHRNDAVLRLLGRPNMTYGQAHGQVHGPQQ